MGRLVTDGLLVSEPCRVIRQPVLVRAVELVPVVCGGGDDVSAAVIGCVEPVHAGCGDVINRAQLVALAVRATAEGTLNRG